MNEDQKENSGSSPLAQRRARRAPANDDWQIPDEGSGRIRKFVLIAGSVVAVVALGMMWQSSMEPKPITAAEHPVTSGEVGDSGAQGSTANDSSSLDESTAPTNLQEIWQGRIAELDSKRIKAFESRDLEALKQVNVAESPAQTYDTKLLESLENRQAKPVSHQTTIHSAKLISGDNESALVEVVDSRSEYVVTTESMNKTIKRFKAKSKTKWHVSLRNIDGGWRIYSVVSAKA